jgi:two-component system LytT family response regulator
MEKITTVHDPSTEPPYKENTGGIAIKSTGGKVARRLSLPTPSGFIIIDVDEIVYLNSHYNSTFFNLVNGKRIMVSKTIKDYEEILDPTAFFRTHKSSMIHLKYIKEFSRMEKNWAVMIDNSTIAVSRRRLPEFIKALDEYNSTSNADTI